MFVRQNIPMLMQAAKLEVGQDEKNERTRLAELSLAIETLPFDLAAELGDDMLVHFFNEDEEIRPNLKTVKLTPYVARQCVTVSSAPDAPALATIRNVGIMEFTVTRKADEHKTWLTAVLKVKFDLGDRDVREFLFHHFGEYRLFSFSPEQLNLLADTVETVATGDAPHAKQFIKSMRHTMSADESVSLTTTDRKGRKHGVKITPDKVERIN